MQIKIMKIVTKMCDTQSTNCRSLNKVDLAKELLTIANVPENAEIQEIPLDWNNQVVVLFLLPNDNNYYSLFAGIGNSGNFCFELTITGILNGNEFEFFDTEKDLDVDYFLNYNSTSDSDMDNTIKEYTLANWQGYKLTDNKEEFVKLLNILEAHDETLESLHEAVLDNEDTFCSIDMKYESERDMVNILFDFNQFFSSQEAMEKFFKGQTEDDSILTYQEMTAEEDIRKTSDGFVRVLYY